MITKLVLKFSAILIIASATPNSYDKNVQSIATKKRSLPDDLELKLTTPAFDSKFLLNQISVGEALSENSILSEIGRAIEAVQSPLCRNHLNATLAGIRERKSWAMASEYNFV